LSRFVLDNSVCAAWCFGDQRTPYTQAVLQDLAEQGEQQGAFLGELRKPDISVRPQDAERTFTKDLDL